MPMWNGSVNFEEAKEITKDFLTWLIEYLKENEPYAINSIGTIEETLKELNVENPEK